MIGVPYKPDFRSVENALGAIIDLRAVSNEIDADLDQLTSTAAKNWSPEVIEVRLRSVISLTYVAHRLAATVEKTLQHHLEVEVPWQVAFADFQDKRLSDLSKPDDAPDADLLAEAHCAARDVLIERTEAPDGPALAFKAHLAFEYSRPFEGLLDGYEAALLADAARLGAQS